MNIFWILLLAIIFIMMYVFFRKSIEAFSVGPVTFTTINGTDPDVSTVGNYSMLIFNKSCTFSLAEGINIPIGYLVVGGGGGASSSGGGGGGGISYSDLKQSTTTLKGGTTYSILVGDGGKGVSSSDNDKRRNDIKGQADGTSFMADSGTPSSIIGSDIASIMAIGGGGGGAGKSGGAGLGPGIGGSSSGGINNINGANAGMMNQDITYADNSTLTLTETATNGSSTIPPTNNGAKKVSETSSYNKGTDGPLINLPDIALSNHYSGGGGGYLPTGASRGGSGGGGDAATSNTSAGNSGKVNSGGGGGAGPWSIVNPESGISTANGGSGIVIIYFSAPITSTAIEPPTETTAVTTQPSKKAYRLSDYVNIQSGLKDIPIYNYAELLNRTTNMPLIQNDNISTSLTNLELVVPDSKSTTNPVKSVFNNYIKQYGAQIIPYRFYLNDTGLSDYEQFFNDNHAGIVPLSMAIRYINKQ